MSTENLFDLYSQKILALAMDIPHLTPIDAYDGHALCRSPVCGSQIEAKLRLENDIIIAYEQDVKTCALGQASAAIFGQHVLGKSFGEIDQLQSELTKFLKEDGDAPSHPFEEYHILIAARDYKNRHASILLAVDVCLEAMGVSKKNSP